MAKFNWEKIKKSLAPREEIAGLEISATAVHFFAFKPSRSAKYYFYEKLPLNTIENGVLIKPEFLINALKNIKLKLGRDFKKHRYVILSLPEPPFYLNVIDLVDVPEEELAESVRLNLELNAPIKPENGYYDFEPISINQPNGLTHYLLTAIASKENIDAYLSCLSSLGFSVVAIEPHSLSLARISYQLTGIKEPYLFLNFYSEGLDAFIGFKDMVVFSDFDSWSEISENKEGINLAQIKNYLSQNIPRFLNFYLSRYNSPIKKVIITSSLAQIKPEIATFLEKEFGLSPLNLSYEKIWPQLNDTWLKAIGAATRGLVPREKDTIISIAPVGTEQAYMENRTLLYFSLWSKVLAAFVFLILMVYASLYYFLFKNLAINFKNQEQNLTGNLTLNERQIELNNRANEFNELIKRIGQAKNSASQNWAEITTEIFNIAQKNRVSIRHLFISTNSKKITIDATASDRSLATNFQNDLNQSKSFTNADLPLTSISESANAISFKIDCFLK